VEFNPYQLGSVGILFALLVMYFWYRRDKKKKEPIFLLVAFFIISALASFAFYSWELYSQSHNGFLNLSKAQLGYLFPFLEELLKASILVFVLELAQEKFDEINDGIIYGAVVALGFVLIENTLYAFSAPIGTQGTVLLLRSLLTSSLHVLTTVYFGYFYANAYLNKNQKLFDKKNRSKPHQIFRHLSSYTARYRKKMQGLTIPYAMWRILTLHITRNRILLGKPSSVGKPHRSGEYILEGFIGAIYMHWIFNASMVTDNHLYRTLAVIMPIMVVVLIFIRFNHIDHEFKVTKRARAKAS
jgi:RsiW-degrading membrane proteinase PrsW (M82 family)